MTITPDQILITDRLRLRPARAREPARELEAMSDLAWRMLWQPETLWQGFVDRALDLCAAGSAGISQLETAADGAAVFRWTALAGAFAPYVGGSTPRDFSPCGLCLDHGGPILVAHPAHLFTYFAQASPPIVEGLIVPLHDADGRAVGTIWIVAHDEARVFDATDVAVMGQLAGFFALACRMVDNAVAEREAARARLDLALDAAGAGVWDWDPAADRSTWSRQMFEVFGLDPAATMPSLAALLQVVHPEDLPRVRAAVDGGGRTDFREEFRIVHPTRGERWIAVIGRLERGSDGKLARGSGINIDVTERKQAEEALRRAKEFAERANTAKSRFLAAASHDLRQPLQALDLQRAVLARQVAQPEALQALRELGQSIEVMRTTLDVLLDLSQLETGAIKAEVGEVRLDELFQRIVGEFRGLAAAKGLAFKVVPSAALVRSDPRLLERILQNLVGNAVKYTRAGKVLLGARRRGGQLRIEVWDTGIGIAEDQLEVIFEEFFQVANPARERRFGHGLGLAIVRAAAGLLGHRLDVRSSPDRGSVFTVAVPFVRHTRAQPIRYVGRADVEGTVPAAAILLVEDDAAIRSALRALLELDGYKVRAAASGDEALRLVEQGLCRPALVLADQNLPGAVSGVATVQRLRDLLTEPHLPGLVLTGDVLPERLAAIRSAGLPYLTKPIGADELQVLVRSLVGGDPSPPVASASLAPQPPPAAGSAAVGPAAQRQPTVYAVENDAVGVRSLQRLRSARKVGLR